MKPFQLQLHEALILGSLVGLILGLACSSGFYAAGAPMTLLMGFLIGVGCGLAAVAPAIWFWWRQ